MSLKYNAVKAGQIIYVLFHSGHSPAWDSRMSAVQDQEGKVLCLRLTSKPQKVPVALSSPRQLWQAGELPLACSCQQHPEKCSGGPWQESRREAEPRQVEENFGKMAFLFSVRVAWKVSEGRRAPVLLRTKEATADLGRECCLRAC